eukprot:4559341-Prymnesium_polylepis.1
MHAPRPSRHAPCRRGICCPALCRLALCCAPSQVLSRRADGQADRVSGSVSVLAGWCARWVTVAVAGLSRLWVCVEAWGR